MTTYIALLRAVNVGGTGKLPMKELVAICEQAGLADVRTYIASGNVILTSKKSESQVKSLIEKGLENYAGKSVGVVVRTATEMAGILSKNPFTKAAPNHTVVIFLDNSPPSDSLRRATGVKNERLQLGKREIYVHCGDGIGTSKLKIPAAKSGTAESQHGGKAGRSRGRPLTNDLDVGSALADAVARVAESKPGDDSKGPQTRPLKRTLQTEVT